jgi:hypothetical protein
VPLQVAEGGAGVRGHAKVPTGGRERVPAGGHPKVPTFAVK